MLNYTKKKRNKLNTYRAARESIILNKINNIPTEQANSLIYENLIFQMTDINLTNHLNNHKKGVSGKIVVKWWEN